MCVIFFYVDSNPAAGEYKLILASNRDEFYARNTSEAAKWDNGDVYGGIDLEPGREGGTWLAIGGHDGIFKIGALLNLTGEPRPRNAIGRGMIVADFVSTGEKCPIEEYNRDLLANCGKYTAFNFVSIEIRSRQLPATISLCSNVPPALVQYEERKCYGFGNSLPAKPFEKVQYGRNEFQKIVEEYNEKLKGSNVSANSIKSANNISMQDDLVKNLQNLLKCKRKFWPDAELKRRAPNWGEGLSSLNVRIPNEGYGSRTHTVILIDANDRMHFYEETMADTDPDGKWHQTEIIKDFFQS